MGSGSRGKGSRCAYLLFAIALRARGAAAEPLPWLTFRAPESCPGQEQVERSISAYLARPLDGLTDFAADVRIEPSPTGFSVHMTLANGAHSGSREVAFPSCQEAADFVSLSIALAIDPGGVKLDNSVDVASAPSMVAAPAVALDAPDAPAAPNATPAASGAVTPLPEPPSTLPAASEPQESQGRIASPELPPPTRSQERPTASQTSDASSPWFVSAAILFMAGPLPGPGVGPTLGGGKFWGDWAIEADLSFVPEGSYELDKAFTPVSFGWLGGSVGSCRLHRARIWNAGLCARTQFGAITAQELIAEAERPPYGGTGFYFGLLFGLEGNLQVVRGLHIRGAAAGAVPLVADPFVLLDGTLVYRAAPGFQGSLGLAYFF